MAEEGFAVFKRVASVRTRTQLSCVAVEASPEAACNELYCVLWSMGAGGASAVAPRFGGLCAVAPPCSPPPPSPSTQELWVDFLEMLARLLQPGQILEAARGAGGGERHEQAPMGRQVSAARLLTEGGVEVQSALSSAFLLQVGLQFCVGWGGGGGGSQRETKGACRSHSDVTSYSLPSQGAGGAGAVLHTGPRRREGLDARDDGRLPGSLHGGESSVPGSPLPGFGGPTTQKDI